MRALSILLISGLLSGCAPLNVNKSLYVASTAALVADWGQTRYIAANPVKVQSLSNGRVRISENRERNPFLGRHPSLDQVDRYFTGWVLGNTLLYLVLPERYQPYWFGGLLTVETACVAGNWFHGVRFNFGM